MSVARAVKDVFIVAAKRTPFGTFGGKLANYSPTDLQEIAFRGALAAGNVKPEWVNSVIVGSVMQSTSDAAAIPRHAAIRVGIPIPVPAHLVNILCGSGFMSIVAGAREIMLGDCDVVLTGGSENMSLAPYALRGARFGVKLGTDLKLEDLLWSGLADLQIKMPMGITAENVAEKYNISREECDAWALQSNKRWKNAHDNGYFKEEMTPITLKTKKGEEVMDMDEHPKPETTIEKIAKLPPVFKKNGVVNAANSSGICDGASSVILANEAAISRYGLKPLARLTGYGIAGVEPSIMGIGPAPAIRGMLEKTGMKLEEAETVEVNEAFAAQYLGVQKELGLDPEKTNTNGGACAIGHPVGASGNRITGHLAHEIQRRGLKKVIGSACIGAGQGICVQLESV